MRYKNFFQRSTSKSNPSQWLKMDRNERNEQTKGLRRLIEVNEGEFEREDSRPIGLVRQKGHI